MRRIKLPQIRRARGHPSGSAILTVSLLLVCLVTASACGGDGAEVSPSPPDPSVTPTPFQLPARSPTQMELPIRIAVTLPIFEEFARQAGGENVEVFSLIPRDADPHSYVFTEQDIARMRGVDFFFLNGLGLDSRLQEVIEANRDENSHVIPFAPNIQSPGGDGRTAEQAGDNPHLWLDPALAYVYAEIVADELIIYDGVRMGSYEANFAAFKERMLGLQDDIYSQLQAVPAERRKMITYHHGLEHFGRKFDLEIAGYAVETPQEAPAPDAVGRLAQTVQDQRAPAVFAEHGYDSGLMREVAAQAGARLCTLYTDIVDPDLSYEEMMHRNADEILLCLVPGS